MIRVAIVLAVCACHADEPVGEVSGVLFGAAVSATGDDASREMAYASAEMLSARHFDLDRIYRQWDDPVPGAREQWTIANGRTPVVSFKTDVAWALLAAGDADDTLTAIANGFAALSVPAFCIFDQDPENSAASLGTPGDYVAAYRHVVAVFHAAGVTNVVWIFNLKSPSFADLADQYYPGDDVVDWIGASAYNYGINSGGRWVSFADLIADFVAWSVPHGKPLIVSEWSSAEDNASPGRKAGWIEDAQATIHATPAVRAMSAFWDEADQTAFDSSASSLDAFRAFAADPYTHLRDSP